MSNLYVNVTYNGNNIAASKFIAAYTASQFVQNPKERSDPPPFAAVNTQATDSSGNAELTGLTSGVAYWVGVLDDDGMHWTYCYGRVGNSSGDRMQCSYALASIIGFSG